MSDQPTPREMGYYVALAQTGVEMIVPAIGGYYLDQWLETTPWITVIAAAFGFAAGLTHLIYLLKQKEKYEADQRTPRGGDGE